MGNEDEDQPADGTWHELPSKLSLSNPGTFTKHGLRTATAQLIYIGSPENGFADAGKAFELGGLRKVQFGRIAGEGVIETAGDDHADIGIPIPWVSGAHAELELTMRDGKPPTLRLTDLGSRNGTAIEGKRLEGGAELLPNQVFELGRTFWMIRELLAGSPPAPAELEPTGTANPGLARIYRNLDRIAHTKMPVLLVGETGTGKDYLARAIHARSGRKGEFVKINLVGISMGELLMGEGNRPGLLQQANGGTVYVDELAALERDAQTKLGSLLSYADDEDGTARGDLRVIASTTRDLRALVEAGEFRPDLYSRLAHYEAHIPALRERREDMGLLLRKLTRVRGSRPLKVDTAAFRRMLGFSWPFNVRELRQTIAAVNALADDGVVTLSILEEVLRREASLPDDPAALQQMHDTLLGHMRETRGNVQAVARLLGRPLEEVERILQQFHIDPASFSTPAPAPRSKGGTLVDMVTSDVFDDEQDG